MFNDIAKIAGEGDYRNFARIMDQAMKEWDVIPKETGYVDGKLISETGEIIFDPENACYAVQTPYCGYYSGAPKELISLSDMVKVKAENKRITLAFIAKEENNLDQARNIFLLQWERLGWMKPDTILDRKYPEGHMNLQL